MRDGGEILYVDHTDTEGLRAKYTPEQLAGARLVDVDKVWGAQTLQECLGPERKVDYVVNSHVVEHVPDLVTWLREIHAILRPDGCLRMAIPDRRFTFDYLRRESTLAEALDAYIRRARAPLPRAILDHFLHEAEIDPAAAWDGRLRAADVQPKRAPHVALEHAIAAHRSGDYVDAHCWVFTPLSSPVFAENSARSVCCRSLASASIRRSRWRSSSSRRCGPRAIPKKVRRAGAPLATSFCRTRTSGLSIHSRGS